MVGISRRKVIVFWLTPMRAAHLFCKYFCRQDRRRFILDNQENEIPLGLLLGNWPSADLMTAITKILLEEALGFHAEVQEVKASYGASPIWALAGCLDFDAKNLVDKRCGEQETRYHISVDSWIGSYVGEYDSMRDAYPNTVPVDLGRDFRGRKGP